MIYEDDECIFKIFSCLIDNILVENVEDDSCKALLYFKLNIVDNDNYVLNFNDFLLLFSNG